MSKPRKAFIYSLFIWTLAILFFFYEFFLRVLPATVAQDIIQSLGLNIEKFAIIGSAYYLVYSVMQIPVGLLLDRFSERLLITLAVSACTLGALWLSVAQGFWDAFIARLMIGFGSSFGFVSLMIVTLNWFPRKYFAFLVGCGQFLGAIGPLCAGTPIALILKATNNNWRLVFLGVALFGAALSILIGIFLRGKPSSKEKIVFADKSLPLSQRIKTLLVQPQIWFTFIYAALTYVALPILGAFWGTSYLETRGFNKPLAALIISMIWLGLAIGSPVLGKLSDTLKRRKLFIILCSIFGVLASLAFLYTPSKNVYYLSFLFFAIGIAGSGQNLSFAIIADYAPKNLRATALSLNNTAIMGFAAIMPPIITSIIQNYTQNKALTESAFERGLLAIPIFFVISLIISIFFLKETFCREQNQIHIIKK